MEPVIGAIVGSAVAFVHWWMQSSSQLRSLRHEWLDTLPPPVLEVMADSQDRAKAARRRAIAPLLLGSVVTLTFGLLLWRELQTRPSIELRVSVAGLYAVSTYAYLTGYRYLHLTRRNEPLNGPAVILQWPGWEPKWPAHSLGPRVAGVELLGIVLGLMVVAAVCLTLLAATATNV